MRLIDEHSAIDALMEILDRPNHAEFLYADEICGTLDQLPTIEPENDWIPCDERMPEEHEWIGTKRFGTTISDEVYVTFETPDGQRFAKHISFQNGNLSSPDKRSMEVWYNDAKPIAWKPLPKPYKAKAE